ncbi:Glucan endo-1,3-beta-glucosidase 1 [Apostasia shenzhenica]|uniref:Glucan endo-1,3-beta-glucosidase 1 n=1 Tax=Apostasia shenzhenica TaxID=1088818 RepID=A0A2I0A1C9_9ASPA|nr:Glucan endo-1,3-beta-glucosidase 1 [Apostasia shenzhenica]
MPGQDYLSFEELKLIFDAIRFEVVKLQMNTPEEILSSSSDSLLSLLTRCFAYASYVTGSLQIIFPNGLKSISLATTSGGTFCVAKSSADPTALKLGIDWACGPGLANCSLIQPGQPCYVANNLEAIASYAYNEYYQANQARGGTCSFNNTAMLTSSDPSNGSCIFSGSSGTGTNLGGGGATGGSGATNGSVPSGGNGSISPTFSPPIAPLQPNNNDINDVSRLQVYRLVYVVSFTVLPLFIL